jgi:rhamnogalacturonan endolyase
MNKNISMKSLTMLLIIFTTTFMASAQRQMENLDRGLVAVKTDEGVFLSWRILAPEMDNTAFNIYRDSEKIANISASEASNYTDENGTVKSAYTIKPVVNGKEINENNTAKVWNDNFLEIPLKLPEGYTPGDASVGDLTGDGQYEIVIHVNGRGHDNSHSGLTDEPVLQAYTLNGTLLWEINLGKNIREGAHYTQFMVYDLDGDGISEIACKTAPGTKDGTGSFLDKGPAANDDDHADFRSKSGRSEGSIIQGPEYLTVFSGQTGHELATTNYIPARINGTTEFAPQKLKETWGDNYGNRSDRFLACVAYLDGKRPSLVMARGYYTRTVLAAWNYRDGQINHVWTFDSNTPGNEAYAGQGNHNLAVGDVDNDGRDEIIYGACAIDHDGTGLYSTEMGHGDAGHLSDFAPDRPGMEYFMPHERKGPGAPGVSFRDAATGEIIWEHKHPEDVGRGVMADITADHPGAEAWAIFGLGPYNVKGEPIEGRPQSYNFLVWWDGDELRELLDKNHIDKFGHGRLFTADDCRSINWSKSTPNLSADIFGDWREEVIWRTSDNKAIRIYTTTITTQRRLYTLMHDPVYRLSIAWQNVAYNQPPHTGFFLGADMPEPPVPEIYLVK